MFEPVEKKISIYCLPLFLAGAALGLLRAVPFCCVAVLSVGAGSFTLAQGATPAGTTAFAAAFVSLSHDCGSCDSDSARACSGVWMQVRVMREVMLKHRFNATHTHFWHKIKKIHTYLEIAGVSVHASTKNGQAF
jgi:hypothetical protein